MGGFKNRDFSKPIHKEQEKEPKRLIIISCEGRNTEPEYFETIKSKLSSHISLLIEIEVVPKNDNKSDPQNIILNLEKFIEEQYNYLKEKYGHQGGYDEMWLVLDREKVESRRKAIRKILPDCKKKGYYIALTNPLFEFWLLLHVADISQYSRTELYENNKVSSKKRFIDKELSNILEGGFNKKRGRFNKRIVSRDNIERALKQEAFCANEVEEIIDNLGSNVGKLVAKIFDDQYR